MVLEKQPDLHVVGEASDGYEAIEKTLRLNPDVIVMDIAMPQLNGIEATRQVREQCPNAKLIMLSMYSSAELILQAFKAGASGYLTKAADGYELVHAIRAVYAGNRFLSQKIADVVIESYVQHQTVVEPRTPLESLSARERQVLQLLVEGASRFQIADKLGLSPKSIATYRSRIMHKLNVHELAGLIKFALAHGVTPPE